MSLDQIANPGITPDLIWGKLLEIEGYLAGRGTDLLTPNQVYTTYAVTQYRLDQAIEDGDIKPYDTSRVAEGGRKSYKVRRSDVIRFFKLPALPAAAEQSESRPLKRARRRS